MFVLFVIMKQINLQLELNLNQLDLLLINFLYKRGCYETRKFLTPLFINYVYSIINIDLFPNV